MKIQSLDQFKALAAELRTALPTAHVDEYPSSHHFELRVTHKLNSSTFLTFTWRKSGVTVQVNYPHMPHSWQRKKTLAVELPSVTFQYMFNTCKKYLYEAN
jgi:hypothetical protein